MIIAGRPAKILLIDSNVYFAKRLSDALKREGFEVISSTQGAFALTTIEYDMPSIILCSTQMREMNAHEIAKIIHADPKTLVFPLLHSVTARNARSWRRFRPAAMTILIVTAPPR